MSEAFIGLHAPERVAVWRAQGARYPQQAPFHPGEAYPECPFPEVGSEPNDVYQAVRDTFRLAGLDAENYGTAAWNPLRGLVRPGETVLLKPNLVYELHPRDAQGWRYVLTQGSVVRAVADYIWKALEGRGRLVLADAPITEASFSRIAELLGLNAIHDYYAERGLPFELVDLRLQEWTVRDSVIQSRRTLPGDPRGGVAFDLADASELADHPGGGRYYGADYKTEQVNHHHTGGRHEYKIAGSAIVADVVFSLPKLKTHKKAGITATLKNLVGVNGDKNWLPHHTEGDPQTGGDEHPRPGVKHRAERALVRGFRRLSMHVPVLGPWVHHKARQMGKHVFGDTEKVIRSGNWSGNDTVWRMCLDLNKLIFYGNPDGTLRAPGPEGRKRHLSLVDGIVAGEGSGPLNPDPVEAGELLFGEHPASVDAACAWLMGLDPARIPIVRGAFQARGYPLAEWGWDEVRVLSNVPEWNACLPEIPDHSTFHFRPHFGWKGRIERASRAAARSAA
jgi:uncharacterized protein (DUF362 family)